MGIMRIMGIRGRIEEGGRRGRRGKG